MKIEDDSGQDKDYKNSKENKLKVEDEIANLLMTSHKKKIQMLEASKE